MIDLLPLTLEGNEPVEWQVKPAAALALAGEGVLELTPRQPYRRNGDVGGVHGNETAPIELLNQLVGDLLTGRLPLRVRLLVVLGNPAAMRAGKRYLHSDMNRMFGGRYRNFAASGETVRAQQLERALAAFSMANRRRVSITICTPPSVNRVCRALAFCLSRNARTASRC